MINRIESYLNISENKRKREKYIHGNIEIL